MLAHSENGEERQSMPELSDHIINKGGRPKKAVKKDQLLGVKCSLIERKAIEANARSVNLTISEYLRKMALTGKIERSEIALPKAVLFLLGTLNHVAANVNQIAYKRNRGDVLNALERAKWAQVEQDLRELIKKLRSHFA